MARKSQPAEDLAAVAQLAAAASRQAPKPDGLAWGLHLHRWVDPKHWPAELERVPAEHRQEAETYLRSIAARMRVLRDLKRHGPDGPPSR